MDQATKPNSTGASDVMIAGWRKGEPCAALQDEEELLIIEPGTGRPRALAGAVIRPAGRA